MPLSFEEHDRRVTRACQLLCSCQYKHEVKKALRAEFGVGRRGADLYISKARKRMVEGIKESVEDQRAESLAFYKAIAQDRSLPPNARLKAQQSIDKLLGLRVPVPTEISGPGGGPITFSLDQVLQASEAAEQELAAKTLPVVVKALPPAAPVSDFDLQGLLASLPNQMGAADGREPSA